VTDRAAMEYLDLEPILRTQGDVTLPGSKSISNRMLLLAALAEGTTEVSNLLASDDTQVMLEALRRLGVPWQRQDESANYRITGVGGRFPVKSGELFLGNAGTALRPLTAVLAFCQGEYRLSGAARMHERPIGDLVEALRQLGANISYLANEGFPPLAIRSAQIGTADGPLHTAVRGNVSSQFLSALLMALPLTGNAATIQVIGDLISKPYVEVTVNLLARFGVQVERRGWAEFSLAPKQIYRSPRTLEVEGDASSASYFLAAGAIGGGPVRVHGVGRASIQGDVRFTETIAKMGARIEMGDAWIEARSPLNGKLQAIDVDLNHIPDAAMTVAMMALFAEGTTTIRNVASWRVKETDRLAAMAIELRKLGAIVDEGLDYLRITPPSQLMANATIDTYDDHRMAMCFSLAALGNVAVRINDPKCVNKTFPGYFQALAQIARA
jgi:3-phosphoshikimate 1-carboxyvinyltransferase